MKHLTTLFAACTMLLGASIHSNAQSVDKFGISGSYSRVSQVWGNDPGLHGFGKEPLHSFSAFIFAESYLNRSFSLRSQLGYQGVGYAPTRVYDASGPYSNPEGARIHQVALDMALKAYLGNKDLRPYLFGGLRSGYILEVSILEPYPTWDFYVPEFDAGNFNKWGLSAITGVGLEWKQRLFFETELNLGFTPSFHYENTRGYDRGVSFRLGYSFIRPSVCRSKHIGITPLF
ncbi:MAG: outer membrane beta-barrel protein [Bacteroidia bacterium]